MPVADAREARRHRAQREIGRIGVGDLAPVERRAKRARRACGRIGVRAGHGAVLGILVVVDEHAVPLLLPPLARGERRHAPLDLAGERQRGAADLVVRPPALDAHEHVQPALARRLRPAAQAVVLERRAARRARLRAPATTARRRRDRDRCEARRDGRGRSRARDADAARGRRDWPSTRGRRHAEARPPRRCGRRESESSRPRSTADALSAHASGRRTRRRCRRDSGPGCWAGRRTRAARLRQRSRNSGRRRAWCSRLRKEHLARIGDGDVVAVEANDFDGRGRHRGSVASRHAPSGLRFHRENRDLHVLEIFTECVCAMRVCASITFS